MHCTGSDNDLSKADHPPREIQVPKPHNVVFERDLFKVYIYIFLTY